MKGLSVLALKVFLYTCGAVIGGLCAAFGIGLLLAAPASPATLGVPGSAASAAAGTFTVAAPAIDAPADAAARSALSPAATMAATTASAAGTTASTATTAARTTVRTTAHTT